MSINNFCREYRKQNGLSQTEFAYLCGVSGGSTISRYETKSRAVLYKTAKKIESYLADKTFTPPSEDDVMAYFKSLPGTPGRFPLEDFFDHYKKYGWRIKDTSRIECKRKGEEYRPMVGDDWKIAVRKWAYSQPTKEQEEQLEITDMDKSIPETPEPVLESKPSEDPLENQTNTEDWTLEDAYSVLDYIDDLLRRKDNVLLLRFVLGDLPTPATQMHGHISEHTWNAFCDICSAFGAEPEDRIVNLIEKDLTETYSMWREKAFVSQYEKV